MRRLARTALCLAAGVLAAACGHDSPVTSGTGVVTQKLSSIAVSATHTCGIATSGAMFCWGSNAGGELGYAGGDSETPVAVLGGHTFTSVGVGYGFTCGIETGGAVLCWGAGGSGQTGYVPGAACPSPGFTPCSNVPAAIPGSLRFAALSVGHTHSCAITAEGVAYCWGLNAGRELGVDRDSLCAYSDGQSTLACRHAPARVTSAPPLAEVSAGEDHTCGRTAKGDVYCWGAEPTGTVGAVRRDGLPRMTQISAGRARGTCGVDAARKTYCWTGLTGSVFPLDYPAFSHVEAQRGTFLCGLTPAKQVLCAGDGTFGQLGDGSNSFVSRIAASPVSGGHSFTELAIDIGRACAIDVSGAAWCWGAPQGLGSVAHGRCGAFIPEFDLSCALEPAAVVGGIRFRTG